MDEVRLRRVGGIAGLRVRIYTHCFYPENLSALSKRMGDLAKALVREGHEVTVVTALPNHPYGVVYEGYGGRWVAEEEWEMGIRVVRCRSYARPFTNGRRRILNQVSLMLSMLTLGGWRLRGRGADVVVTISPPLFAALAGALTAKARRIPFVLDVQDLWPEEAVAVGGLCNPVAVRLAAGVARFLYRNAARVAVISEGFARTVVAQGGERGSVCVIPNWVREDSFEDHEPKSLPGVAGFRVVFAGTIGMAQGLDVVLEAAERLGREVHFVLVGEGVEKARLREEAWRRGLENVHFLPAVDQSEVPKVLAAADALLVHLRPGAVFEQVIPSKTYESLAAGRTVLVGVPGEAARLVEGADAGLAFPSGDSLALVRAVEKLMHLDAHGRRRMGERGRARAREFSVGTLTARYVKLVREAVEGRG